MHVERRFSESQELEIVGSDASALIWDLKVICDLSSEGHSVTVEGNSVLVHLERKTLVAAFKPGIPTDA